MSFVRACALSEVAEGSSLAVEVGATEVAIVNTAEGVFAIHDVCSHAEIPLSEGDVEGTTIECYMHGSHFDLRTGRPLELPATVPVPVYPVRVDGGDVLIDLAHPIQSQEL